MIKNSMPLIDAYQHLKLKDLGNADIAEQTINKSPKDGGITPVPNNKINDPSEDNKIVKVSKESTSTQMPTGQLIEILNKINKK